MSDEREVPTVTIEDDAPDEPSGVDLLALLDGVTVLRALPSDAKRALLQHVERRRYADGQTVVAAGEPGDALYIVAAGEVTVLVTEPSTGLPFEVARLGPGETLGEMTIFSGAPRSADAHAVGPVEVLVVQRDLFLRIVRARPDVALDIAGTLADRLRLMNAERGVRFGSLRGYTGDPELLALTTPALIRRLKMVPVQEAPDGVLVATPEPYNRASVEEMRRLLRGRPIKLLAVAAAEFDAWVGRFAGRREDPALRAATPAQRAARVVYEGAAGTAEPKVAPVASQSVTDLLSTLLLDAVERDASDIFLEPGPRELKVRFRVDGRMQSRGETIAAALHAPLVSRVKVLAGADITNRRRPQDGRFGIQVGEESYDLRISTVATLHGEKVAIRLLDSGRLQRNLSSVVLWDRAREALRALVYQPSGLLLVTGPSGSGKTTTLYAALQERAAPDLAIATVEDPVEYEIPGITQVQVSEETGLDYPTVLRAFLRQSPDIVLVGEMRDRATTDLTANAALTGHLVLSSFHTNDALGAITRLRDMQVEPFVLSAALAGVVNQRLVRKLCERCREPATLPELALQSLARAGVRWTPGRPVYRPRGCPACGGQGFRGRVGMFEVLDVSPALRDAIAQAADNVELRRAARTGVYLPFADYAAWLLGEGLTVPSEVLRVLPMA